MFRRLLGPLALVMALAALATVAIRLAPRWLPGLRQARALQQPVPSLDGVAAWLGSPRLTADSLRDRPLALLLWTDTDPRALDALPVLDAWHHAFAPLGARVLAVHVPDFAFAADSTVPARWVRRLGLTLPVALDPSLTVASAMGGVPDGPHLLVADAHGEVRVDTVGLAGLPAGELALREAIRTARPGAPLPPALAAPADRAVRAVYLGASRSPEGPLAGLEPGTPQTFTAEFRYQQEEGRPWVPYPVGAWTPGADGLLARRGGATDFVSIRYSAARAGVIASAPTAGACRLWVLRDDHWPGPDTRGDDVTGGAGGAWVDVAEPRLYWLDRAGGNHVLQVSPERAGLVIHAFVFDGVPADAVRK